MINTSMTTMCMFEIDEQVLVRDESVCRGRSKKLEASYVGPYEIVGIQELNLLV